MFVVIQNNRCGIKPLLDSGFVIYGIISLDLLTLVDNSYLDLDLFWISQKPQPIIVVY